MQGLRQPILSGPVTAWSAAFVCFAVALFSPALLNDGDTYWHIEAGRWMIDNWTVLRIDPFSFSFAGRPWQTHEWLSEVVLALGYVGPGWSGVLIIAAGCFALTAGLLGRYVSQRLSGVTLIVTLVLSLACIAGSLLARPHLLALPLLTVWTAKLIEARDRKRPPSFWLVPMMTLWANLHASFLFGLVLIVPFALEALQENRTTTWNEVKGWAAFAAAALVAAAITPFGIDTLIFPVKLMSTTQLSTIVEWRPSDLSWTDPLMPAIGATLFVLLSKGAKIRPLRLLVLLGLMYLALTHTRHQMLLGIVGPLLLAEPLAGVLNGAPPALQPSRRRIVIGFALAFLLAAGGRLLLPIARGDDPATPAAAFAQVPSELRHAAVFNEYAFGGFLIFNGVRPFIDGRAELYGDDFLAGYDRAVRPDATILKKLLVKYRIRWTILAARNPAVGAMDAMPGWRRLYADRNAVVHVKAEP